MAAAIYKSVVSKTYKFLEIDRSTEPSSRCLELPDDFFQPKAQMSKLDPETKELHLEVISTKNNGDADLFHPPPITMSAHYP